MAQMTHDYIIIVTVWQEGMWLMTQSSTYASLGLHIHTTILDGRAYGY